MRNNSKGILIGGTGSGSGKTTITMAILKALKDQEKRVCSFKCGPDYIDPAFASEVVGVPSRNLDEFLMGEKTLKYLLWKNSKDFEIAICEGVMGLYDGRSFEDDSFSSNQIALKTGMTEILVASVKGKGYSLLAEISGYVNFTRNNIKGIILNQCSEAMFPVYKKLIESGTDIEVIGFMPRMDEVSLESRHLGLVTAVEMLDLEEKIKILGEAAKKHIDIDRLVDLASPLDGLSSEDDNPINVLKDLGLFTKSNTFQIDERSSENQPRSHVVPVIAISKDKAFSFMYQDNIDLLKELGAEIRFFSPLNDENLPDDASALWLCGGYPELYLEELTSNVEMMRSLREVIVGGMPTIGECGGFMLMGRSIEDKEGKKHETLGIMDSHFHMTDRLVRFGYKMLEAKGDSMIANEGEKIPCHEFHYSDGTFVGDDFVASRGMRRMDAVVATESLFAGYPHIHLWGNVNFAKNFVDAARAYRLKKKQAEHGAEKDTQSQEDMLGGNE